MRFELGDKVVTHDGHEIGSLKHLVLDPATAELRSAVVEHGFINRESKMVPMDLIEGTENGRVRLRCSRDDVARLQDFVETDYTAPPPGYTVPLSYPGGGLLWPLAYPVPGLPDTEPGTAEAEESERLRAQNLENAVIDSDSDVVSRDGEKLGEIERLEIDSLTGKPSRLVIRKGFLLPETLELPISSIASVDDGVVQLNLSKDEALRMATPAPDA